MANKTITQLDAAQSLNDNMVIAVQDTNTTYKTTLADVKAYCGGGSGGDAYKVGDRVNDDSDNPVGTVSSIFTDGNGDRYAVVCLDAVNRLASGIYCSKTMTPVDSEFANLKSPQVFNSKDTATFNTQKILDFCASDGEATSSACTHCRSKTFTIDGLSYSGQLPNLNELINIVCLGTEINSNDPTVSQYTSLRIPEGAFQQGIGQYILSSSKWGVSYPWQIADTNAVPQAPGKPAVIADQLIGVASFVIPVLEIPLED